MPGFRYELKHDLALATEVASTRPTKPAEWESVASMLSQQFSIDDKPVQLKGRGCRERLELLLKKYNDDDKKALKKSGTEEEYSELSQLLEDILVYQRDFATVREEDKKKENLKKEDDRKKGEEMRQAAMQSVARRMSSPTLELDEDDVDDSSVDSGPLSKRMKLSSSGSKRASKVAVIDLLREKYEKKASLKEKELELKKMELQLQERKLALEEEERRKKLELDAERQKIEAEERKTILELLKKNM